LTGGTRGVAVGGRSGGSSTIAWVASVRGAGCEVGVAGIGFGADVGLADIVGEWVAAVGNS